MNSTIIGLFISISLVFLTACVQIQTMEPGSVQTPPKLPARIVFSSERDGNPEIYIMNANGDNETRLTNNLGHDEHPVWSP